MYLHNNVEPEPESRDKSPDTLADRVGAEMVRKEKQQSQAKKQPEREQNQVIKKQSERPEKKKTRDSKDKMNPP